jgi:hypothetical protein
MSGIEIWCEPVRRAVFCQVFSNKLPMQDRVIYLADGRL